MIEKETKEIMDSAIPSGTPRATAERILAALADAMMGHGPLKVMDPRILKLKRKGAIRVLKDIFQDRQGAEEQRRLNLVSRESLFTLLNCTSLRGGGS